MEKALDLWKEWKKCWEWVKSMLTCSTSNPHGKQRSLTYFYFLLRGRGKENWKTAEKKTSKRQDTPDPWDTRETLPVTLGYCITKKKQWPFTMLGGQFSPYHSWWIILIVITFLSMYFFFQITWRARVLLCINRSGRSLSRNLERRSKGEGVLCWNSAFYSNNEQLIATLCCYSQGTSNIS